MYADNQEAFIGDLVRVDLGTASAIGVVVAVVHPLAMSASWDENLPEIACLVFPGEDDYVMWCFVDALTYWGEPSNGEEAAAIQALALLTEEERKYIDGKVAITEQIVQIAPGNCS